MLCELCAAAVARLEYMANASDDKIIIYYHYCSWFVRSAAAARDPRVLWRIVIRLWCSLWRRDPSTATRQPSPSIHSRFGVFRIFWTKRYLICMASLKYSNCICIFERFNWTKTLNTRSHWRSEQFKIGFFLYCRLPRLLLPGSLAPVSPRHVYYANALCSLNNFILRWSRDETTTKNAVFHAQNRTRWLYLCRNYSTTVCSQLYFMIFAAQIHMVLNWN